MDTDRTQPDDDRTRRLTVRQAADELGISAEAVRQRVKRNTLPHEKDGGTVYVILDARHDADQTDGGTRPDDDRTTDRTRQDDGPDARLIDELRAHIEDLRGQLVEERESRRRADTIIAQLARANEEQARTIRELEPAGPDRPSSEPDSAAPNPSRGTVPPQPQTAAQPRSLWRRIFGG